MGVIILGLYAILVVRLFNLQIVNEEYYLDSYIQQAEKTIYTAGTRGLITDRNGNVLAYNKVAYSVVFEDVLGSTDNKNEKLNEIAYNAINIIEKYGDKIELDFPIIINSDGNYEYTFTSDTTRMRFLEDMYGTPLDTAKYTHSKATAAEAYAYICDEKFDISDKYDAEMKMKIATIRYNLFLNSYQKYVTITLSNDVSNETMVSIYENEAAIPGVSIKEQAVRKYNYSEYFAPIIGYTGTISPEQLEEYNNNGKDYISSDVVGKSGIEAAFEDELQGTRGEEKIFADSTGNKLSTISNTDSKAGNNVVLTLDLNLQLAAYDLLEKKIAGLLVSQIVNYDVNPDVDSESDEHPIGVKEVYFQLVNNNVVSIKELSKKRTDNEEKVYNKYKSSLSDAVSKVKSILNSEDRNYNNLSEEAQDYAMYVYDELKSDNILISSAINREDEKYLAWQEGDISLKEFLKYAIANEWIDISGLSIESEYATTEESYKVLVDYILDFVKKNTSFAKRVFYYRIFDGTINGSEICMLLYDQKVLKKDESTYNSLKAYNSVTTYNFIIKQIKELKITPAQLALDPCSGSVVVTDPNNGDVLALVTYPSYDNNMLSGTVDPEYWAKLIDDNSDPLYNRATQGLTAPGSTFKMITAMTVLEEGIVPSAEATLKTKGIFEEITPSPRCWVYPGNHGTINVMEALAYSCDDFFYQTAYSLGQNSKGKYDSDLGLKKIEKYATMVGLNSLSGVEITESEPSFSTESAVHSAIGQGSNSYAPVQLARYVSTIANNGNNYELTLIDKVTDSNGKLVYDNKAEIENTMDISDSTWDAIHKGMRNVITEGTAENVFKDVKFKIAGKTGTAEENKKRNDHGLFVGYAPYDKPKVTVTSVIPYGNSSTAVSELTRDVMKYYFGEMNSKDVANAKVAGSAQNTHD